MEKTRESCCFSKVARKGPSDKITFEQRPKWIEIESHHG